MATVEEVTSGLQRDGRLASVGKKRTRTGCLNCRRKRRKCVETKPTCEGCQLRREACEWGVKLTFRPEHAQTMDHEHPSMRQARSCSQSQGFQIVDVTSEVIRDYLEESMEDLTTEHATPADAAHAHVSKPERTIEPVNIVIPQLAPPSTAAHLSEPPVHSIIEEAIPETFVSPSLSDPFFEDGIFLPGSQYQELHAALRNAIHDTARSTHPSVPATPDLESSRFSPDDDPKGELLRSDEDEESRRLAHLSPEQECILWQNYIRETAGWLDKFDINRHFELVLPIMAKSHPHLKYSILALSARQMERKERTRDSSCSLALYQHAIHLLSPLLQTRTTVVLASCVVLCVLEMLSCAPKAWRRHLDGCAALIQALGITGASHGLESALFWVFARMDVCGGLISSEKTLIPMPKWMDADDPDADIATFVGSFDMYANHMVYLCGRVVDLLCTSGKWEQRQQRSRRIIVDYLSEWTRLFSLVERWYANRPEEMKPLLQIPNIAQPFATTLFGSGPAISGNQMYHTAALLMLKYKPAQVSRKQQQQQQQQQGSLLWHARQICAISISNEHHGAWTNSTQPLWIAGQQMSHASEHRAILAIYERIERETGWATQWRAEDLREFWGEA